MAEVSQSVEPCLYFLTVFYLLAYFEINSYDVMNNSISLKYILVAYWTLTHIQIYTSTVYTSAAEKPFDLYLLEDRMSSSIFEKYRKNGIIRSSVVYVELIGETFCSINVIISRLESNFQDMKTNMLHINTHTQTF